MPKKSDFSQFSEVHEFHEFHIGIMSGTSMDGIDGVLAGFDVNSKPTLISHLTQEFTPELKDLLMSLQSPGNNELHREALAANALAQAYAIVVTELLQEAGLKTEQIKAIGAHGQTIRHQPGLHDGFGYTWQTLNPALLAELTGIDVIADFRSRDIAALGQGAPLVPAFHAAQFGTPNTKRSVLNLGGISNLTLLDPEHPQPVRGFDCGPGNVLMDLWFNRHHQEAFDRDGSFAASGKVLAELLNQLLAEPFLKAPTPKSTGRDLFNQHWLENIFTKLGNASSLAANDIQTTLTHYTAIAAIEHIKEHFPDCNELFVCGGGVRNSYLMNVLNDLGKAQLPQMKILSTSELGIDPQTVEALAFAWLAWAYVHKVPANLPAVTGAKGLRILGACYPS